MAPYFETVKSFADVPISDEGVDTATFLEAADGLVGMFDLLGYGVFAFVQADIRGNVSGVRQRYNAHGIKTLEEMVKHERDHERHWNATPCLVRLIRGLAFTQTAMHRTHTDPHASLHTSFKHAYDAVLRCHHGFVIRSGVYVALRSLPNRPTFYSRIAQGGSREKLDEELEKWLRGLEAIVQRIKAFLEGGGYGRI